MKVYNPEITDFEQDASVVSGIFSYSCKICRRGDEISITATSTNAQGMIINYDGNEVSFIYDNMTHRLDGDKIDKTNPAVAIYDAFQSILDSKEPNVSKTDDGYRYEGTTDLGDFVLLQNDDFSFKSLYFKNVNLNITFM